MRTNTVQQLKTSMLCQVTFWKWKKSASVWFRPQNYFGLFCLKWLLPGCICLNQDLNRVTLVKVYSSHPEKMDCLVLWIGFICRSAHYRPLLALHRHTCDLTGDRQVYYTLRRETGLLSADFFLAHSFKEEFPWVFFFLTSLKNEGEYQALESFGKKS